MPKFHQYKPYCILHKELYQYRCEEPNCPENWKYSCEKCFKQKDTLAYLPHYNHKYRLINFKKDKIF